MSVIDLNDDERRTVVSFLRAYIRLCGHRLAVDHEIHGIVARLAASKAAPAVELSDRQLLAAVHRWARTNGWHYTWIGWADAPYSCDATTVVEWDDDELTVRRRPAPEAGQGWPSVGRGERYPVTSVREAVDVLAALGVLPAELSSAYRAGQAARP